MSEHDILKAEEITKSKLTFTNKGPGLVMVTAGLVLLLSNLFDLHLMTFLWPGFVIAPGLVMMWPAYQAGESENSILSYFAVPGAVVTAVGLMLFVMNLTNHFEAWAYAWALLPAAAAGGLMYGKRFEPDSRIHEMGHRFIRVMVLLFGGFALFFEVLIFQTLQPWLPVLFIGAGIYLLVKERPAIA